MSSNLMENSFSNKIEDFSRWIYLIVIVFTILSCSEETGVANKKPEPEEPQEPVFGTIYLADPSIFKSEDTYYLYGTSQGSLESKGKGFLVFTSSDLINWEGPTGIASGFALSEQAAFGNMGFWAPQVLQYEDNFYMAYTANEKIGIASSSDPLGLFTNNGKSIDDSQNQIDPFIFIDDDGKKYLYHVRLQDGNRIFVAEMKDDLSSIKSETLTEIITAEEGWENTVNASWPVAEGPTVFKANDRYYLVYSANDFRNPDYAVGYATSDHPLGPWTKSENNPIIHGNDFGERGAGHGDLVIEGDKMKYVLHTHFSTNAVHPRKTGIINLTFDGDVLVTEEDSYRVLVTELYD